MTKREHSGFSTILFIENFNNMLKWLLPAFITIISFQNVVAQDKEYARETILKLSSEAFHGRGYAKHGNRKAARFIREEFKAHGLKPLEQNYYQPFNIDINTFPGKQTLRIQGKDLKPGEEFLVNCNSSADKGRYELFRLNTEEGDLDSLKSVAENHDLSDKYVLTANSDKAITENNVFDASGVVVLQEKLWWHISNGNHVDDFTVLKVKRSAIDTSAKELKVHINNRFLESYQTQNVVGYIPGDKHPEKYFFLSAHYDHLGRMGENAYFPGGNDNASGVALMMDLARYFTENPPDFSIVFIAFGAEETGLEGSKYFSRHMPVDAEKVMFSLNLDMVGTGSDGIMVVNGKVLHSHFNRLAAINKAEDYVRKVDKRGEAAISDHYFIYKAGIPAFFVYTMGDEYREYHNLADKGKNVPLTEYEGVFRLLENYIGEFPLKNNYIGK